MVPIRVGIQSLTTDFSRPITITFSANTVVLGFRSHSIKKSGFRLYSTKLVILVFFQQNSVILYPFPQDSDFRRYSTETE